MNKISKMFLAVLTAGFFIGCGGSGGGGGNSANSDVPGDISGFGSNTGEISGEELKLPDNVSIVNYQNMKGCCAFDSTGSEYDAIYGSGTIAVIIPIHNKDVIAKKVDFPAGTIVRSKKSKSQHGVLLKKVSVTIPAGGTLRVLLQLYCGNNFKPWDYLEIHDKIIISDSKTLKSLTDLVVNKKINFEEYSASQMSVFYEISVKVQEAVWDITDRNGLTEANRAYIINNLPNSQ